MKPVLRKCAGCGLLKGREELIKVTVNTETKEVKVNPDTDFFGRSVYVCYNNTCRENALKKGRFFKLLKVKPDETLAEKIRTVLEH